MKRHGILLLMIMIFSLFSINVNAEANEIGEKDSDQDNSISTSNLISESITFEEYVCTETSNYCNDNERDPVDWYKFWYYNGDEITLRIYNRGTPGDAYISAKFMYGDGTLIGDDEMIYETEMETFICCSNIEPNQYIYLKIESVMIQKWWGSEVDGIDYQLKVIFDITQRDRDGDSYLDSHNTGFNVDDCLETYGTSSKNLLGCPDSDGDGWADSEDTYPEDYTEWVDTDGDGYGDNSDEYPEDSTEWIDTDGDGYGDNSDEYPEDPTEWADTDGDDVGDNSDAFPNDSNETLDTDGDGYGDNSDEYPEDPTEWVDTDGDDVGDNFDAFPKDNTQWSDTDFDGFGDNPYGTRGDNCKTEYGNSTKDKFGCIDSNNDGYSDSNHPVKTYASKIGEGNISTILSTVIFFGSIAFIILLTKKTNENEDDLFS